MRHSQTSKRVLPWLTLAASALVLAADTFAPNDQPYGFQAPVALSRTDVKDGTSVAFVPLFDSGNYDGDILAAPVSSSGVVNYLSPSWRASETLAAQNWDVGRRIATFNTETKAAAPFRWDTIGKDERAALVSEPVLNYLRGDRSGESGGGLRERNSLLGSVMHSNPVYVGKPNRGYTFDGYLSFAAANKDRAGRLYVGANDGMLHAFDAATGSEEFAYIPSTLYPYLAEFAQESYGHRYYVDGPLVAEDAYFGGAWHTVLVGNLGAGGMGLFALDITSASVASEWDAASRLLWEFTAEDSSDRLGYTYSRPSIARMNNGSWAVVTGNGYMSKDGKAVLMIIDLATGTLITEIEVDDNNDNGLSSPALVDVDGDYKVDYAYAGDLNGNLWKFDLSSPESNDWDTAWDKKPLFETEYDSNLGQHQPITTAPTIGLHPEGGYFVYVATGQMLDVLDAQGKKAISPQSVYGIWDTGTLIQDSLPIPLAGLLKQSLRVVSHPDDSETVRSATANTPDWSVHQGWATRLDAGGLVPGTRVVTDHVLRDGRVQFTSTDPTTGSGESYLMQLNANTGGAPSQIVIDVNVDGSIDVADNVDGNADGSVNNSAEDRVVGQYLGFGVASMPAVASIGGDDAAIVNQVYSVLAGGKPAVDPPSAEDPGLEGGHIDVDTSTEIYEFDNGSTNQHTHQWDDKHNSTVVNFFDMYDDGFDYINEPGQPPKQGNKEFLISVANAHLSPGAVIEINGAAMPVKEYRAKIKRYLLGNLGPAESFPTYTLAEPTAEQEARGVVKLTSFKLSFAKDTITKGGVHPTATGCVKGNEPGQNNEYRNGALTIQALDATANTGTYVYSDLLSAFVTAPHAIHDQGYAVSQAGVNDGSLFWESTIFWHWGGGCYGIDDKEKYDAAWEEEIGMADDRGTDSDISSDPPPPPEPEGSGDGIEAEVGSAPTYAVSTTRIRGQWFGRLSWRELMIDE